MIQDCVKKMGGDLRGFVLVRRRGILRTSGSKRADCKGSQGENGGKLVWTFGLK